ncbi:hypothetical protein FEM48_Zijuj11G0102300 [Ziziphus jujuba var. spinosa]|uniref:Plastocyanin-like domain-containing protein n=1 Tax=Ziziphus jujuba var. spinosa TaxID=714518 RepID=A0A978UIC9_ZIZJJ|nr:hypothetical protein FEM48_Zijuj11G0102300 [Ziziphus jujuba var. spinosa]
MTVVSVHASCTQPYVTDVFVLDRGQSTSILITFNQPPCSHYMAATALFKHDHMGHQPICGLHMRTPLVPILPAFNDTPTAHKSFTSLTGLVNRPHWVPTPLHVDDHGIYTSDLPDQPSVKFDCTKLNPSTDPLRLLTQKSTKLKKLKFNSTVEIVFQNTAILGIQSHPMRLHGVWYVHCHLEVHLPWGLAVVFEVENGPTPSSTLPPPPPDLPKCQIKEVACFLDFLY